MEPAVVTAQSTLWIDSVHRLIQARLHEGHTTVFPATNESARSGPLVKNGLCAAICFAINNGWVAMLFRIIKLSDGSKMKTCADKRKNGGTNEWLAEGRAETVQEESQMKAKKGV